MDRIEICGGRIELELGDDSTSPIEVAFTPENNGRTHILICKDGNKEVFVVPSTFAFSLIGEYTKTGTTHVQEVGSRSQLVPVLGRDKLRVDLVPMEAVEAIAQVMGWSGSEKYEDWDWLDKYTVLDCWASAFRHMGAWKKGESHDPESDLHHIYHALTRLAMAVYLIKKGGA